MCHFSPFSPFWLEKYRNLLRCFSFIFTTFFLSSQFTSSYGKIFKANDFLIKYKMVEIVFTSTSIAYLEKFLRGTRASHQISNKANIITLMETRNEAETLLSRAAEQEEAFVISSHISYFCDFMCALGVYIHFIFNHKKVQHNRGNHLSMCATQKLSCCFYFTKENERKSSKF